MNIDEAIEHCSEILNSDCNYDCKLNHLQLKDWLIELKQYRKRYTEHNIDKPIEN